MKLCVCLKQVPDTADLRIDPETNTLVREGVEAVLNPLDEFPLEAALRLREQAGGTVTAMTMGPPQAADVLRKAVAMGADEAVLVTDRAFAGADTWATSLTLARAIEALGPFDAILCGKQAIDGDTAQVGPGIAAHLGMPQVTYVTSMAPADDGGGLRVSRQLEQGTAVVEVGCPVVLTVLKEANEPRLPSLSGRLRAIDLEPGRVGLADLGLATEDVGLPGSFTKVIRIAVPQANRRHLRITGDTAGSCRRLLGELQARGVVGSEGESEGEGEGGSECEETPDK